MRLAIALACLLIGAPGQQLECVHDPDACHVGECKVWESSRFVCEPETYAVMVLPSKCLIKSKITPQTYMEMPLNDKGEPDKKRAHLVGTQVEFKPGCGHIEIRKRNINY